MHINTYVCIYIYIYIYTPHTSLSLSIYIYIYIWGVTLLCREWCQCQKASRRVQSKHVCVSNGIPFEKPHRHFRITSPTYS